MRRPPRRTRPPRTEAPARRRLRAPASALPPRPPRTAPRGRPAPRRSRTPLCAPRDWPRSRTGRGRTRRRLAGPPRWLALCDLRLDLLLGGDLLADLLQRAPDQPRHVHLRDPHLLRDLRLGQALEEAEVENPPLALVEDAEPRRQHGPVLGDLVLVLLRPDRLERVELLAVLLSAAGRQRQRRVRAAGLERLEHLFLLGAGRLRQLGDRRRTAELHRKLLDEPRELDVELLQAARHAHRPALVAEVTLDLADDVRRRVRRQLDAAVEVEAVDRLDQADRANLDEILQLLAAIRVAPRQRADERHVLLDQLLSGCEIALLVVFAQQDLVRLLGHRFPSSRFVSSTQPSVTSKRSQTAVRIRRRSSRTARPPSTRWATRRNASSAGSVSEISSTLNPSLQNDPTGKRWTRRVGSALRRVIATSCTRCDLTARGARGRHPRR